MHTFGITVGEVSIPLRLRTYAICYQLGDSFTMPLFVEHVIIGHIRPRSASEVADMNVPNEPFCLEIRGDT